MADDGVKLVVNGETVDFTGDQEPVIQNGRTLVPFRAAFEKMGAEVKWYEDIRLCEAVYGDVTVGIAIGDTKVTVGDGAEIESDVPAQIINGRTMVPLRVLSESIGAKVDWDGNTRTVTVNTPEIGGEAPASVQYDTETDTVEGKISKVTYSHPVVTDKYTAADLLNKNIEEDIKEAATLVADDNATGESEITIDFTMKYNDGGVISVLYLIDGESVYWQNYGIVNGARIEDEEFAKIVGSDTEEQADDTDNKEEATENNADAEVTYEMHTYTVGSNGDDGKSCISATVNYPQFVGEEDFIASLNTQLENSAKKAADSFLASYKDDATKEYNSSEDKVQLYDFTQNSEVEITEDNVAVIKNDFVENVSGKDARTGDDTIKIDLATGEILE
jgi:hypothetical protein